MSSEDQQMEAKTTHLQMIQSVIDRLSGVSVGIKEWSLTVVVGFFALVDKNLDRQFYLIVFLPIVGFWILDAFYLGKEKAYRALFEVARQKEATDFCMKCDVNWADYWAAFRAPHNLLFFLLLAATSGALVRYIPHASPSVVGAGATTVTTTTTTLSTPTPAVQQGAPSPPLSPAPSPPQPSASTQSQSSPTTPAPGP